MIRGAARWLRSWHQAHRVELRLGVRTTVSAVVALVISDLLDLPIALWTVLTAVVLTQVSVGKSLRATSDYLISTLAAAFYAGAVGSLIVPIDETARIVALVLAVAPAAFFAAINPRFSPAPFTAVLVLLAPTIAHVAPAIAALDRVIEVIVGGIVGLVVSIIVLPARAHDLAVNEAARLLGLLGRVLALQLARHPDTQTELPTLRLEFSAAFANLETIASEARRERMTRLAAQADEGPLLRTMSRLRHDMAMIARATELLPDGTDVRLAEALERVGVTASEWLRRSSDSLLARSASPTLDAVTRSIEAFSETAASLRQEGRLQDLPIDAAEHIFALRFAIDQMGKNLADLARCIRELAQTPDVPAILTAQSGPHPQP
jgi:uncharacterized membrane protein YccC